MDNNQNIETEKVHKRRVRYKGTHPRTYAEKYKEQQPEKYADTIEKVIRKGSTPAGMHISICVKEILEFLQIKPGQKGLDATLGYGGHTSKMLECLEGNGHVYGLDIDPIEIEKTKKRLADKGFGDNIFTAINTNFANIDEVAKEYGPFDFVLADLEEALAFIPQKERKEAVKKSCARTFQALRIDVNNEFEVLYDFLEKLPDAMAPGGRVAILTFHSGEDRLVKKAFKALYKQGIFSEIAKDVIRPSAEECNMNPRARSTKMRWAIKN